jgi:hypothetical protein
MNKKRKMEIKNELLAIKILEENGFLLLKSKFIGLISR